MVGSFNNSKRNSPCDKIFSRTTLFLAILSASVSTQAQEVNSTDNAEEELQLEEVVVSGIRHALEKNLDSKRFADSFIDTINAEDIGKFPDKNVADALQRVPGIVITRDGGEGDRVSIRGLGEDLTYTQLNGNYIASADIEPYRSFKYTLLPANMISRAEVIKSPEARYDEGGVGGTIIVHTRSPLAMDANSGSLSAEATYADVTEEYEPQFSGLYSWKNDSETFGVLVAYTSQNRTNRLVGSHAESWSYVATEEDFNAKMASGELNEGTQRRDPLIDNHGNGQTYSNFYAPAAMVGEVFEQDREREGFQFTTQFRPTDNIELKMNYFRFELNTDFENYRLVLPEWNYENAIVPGGIVVEGDTLVSLTEQARPPITPGGDEARFESPQYAGSRVIGSTESDTFDFSLSYTNEMFSVDVIAGVTDAEGGYDEDFFSSVYSTNWYYRDDGQPVINSVNNWSWDTRGGGGLKITSTDDLGGIQHRPDAVVLDWFTSSFGDTTDKENYFQIDFKVDLDVGFIDTVFAGLKYRDHKITRRIRQVLWDDDANDPAFCSRITGADDKPCPPWIVKGSFANNINFHPNGDVITSQILAAEPMGNIIGDALDVMPFTVFNWDGYRNWLNSQFGPAKRSVSPSNVYEVEEQITAAYVQTNFSADALRGNVGIRAVQTDVDTLVYNQISAPGVPTDEYIVRSNSETKFLPSFNIAYDLTDDLVIRGAVSKVMARIPYGNLGGAEVLVFNPGSGNNPDEWRGSGGNPDLQPFEAIAYDISLEWYYAESSGAGIAIYSKDVENFLVDTEVSVIRTVGGDDVVVDPFLTTVNGSDVTTEGVEVFIQHAFDNGFGFVANYTYNNSEQADVTVDGISAGKSALPGVADEQLNLIGYYESDRFGVRISYNKVGETPTDIERGLQTIVESYDQVDANAHYNITDNLVVNFSVINLTESISRSYAGVSNRFAKADYTGRRMYLGLNYKF